MLFVGHYEIWSDWCVRRKWISRNYGLNGSVKDWSKLMMDVFSNYEERNKLMRRWKPRKHVGVRMRWEHDKKLCYQGQWHCSSRILLKWVTVNRIGEIWECWIWHIWVTEGEIEIFGRIVVINMMVWSECRSFPFLILLHSRSSVMIGKLVATFGFLHLHFSSLSNVFCCIDCLNTSKPVSKSNLHFHSCGTQMILVKRVMHFYRISGNDLGVNLYNFFVFGVL